MKGHVVPQRGRLSDGTAGEANRHLQKKKRPTSRGGRSAVNNWGATRVRRREGKETNEKQFCQESHKYGASRGGGKANLYSKRERKSPMLMLGGRTRESIGRSRDGGLSSERLTCANTKAACAIWKKKREGIHGTEIKKGG